MGGGGSEAVWKFSENSSNLVQVNVPNIATQEKGFGKGRAMSHNDEK